MACRRGCGLLLVIGVFAAAPFASPAARTSNGLEKPTKPRPPTTAPSTPAAAVPESRGGRDLVGRNWPDLAFDRWITPDGKPLKNDGSVTLYRWWTNSCPYCASSLPALEELRRKYGPEGLRVVGVYHPKPPREVSDETIRGAAGRIGFKGPLALDTDWSELKRLYLSTGERGATSASFLVDRHGVIRFVHPGPDLFPSQDPEDARQDQDYRAMEKAIQALLAERTEQSTTRPAR
jgi:thiol-disulfide isomerase/thioredoxin